MRTPQLLPEAPPHPALLDKIRAAPTEPGCYLLKNAAGQVIYVGKGKNIRLRVRQYFQNGRKEEKVLRLVRTARDVEFFTTASELDALLHEHRLIKEHRPWFNSQLKQDRARPFLRVGVQEPCPTFSLAAEQAEDGARYFGCFANEDSAMAALVTLNRVWKTPPCGRRDHPGQGRACLNAHLGLCLGPCERKTDDGTYAEAVQGAVGFLSGRGMGAQAKVRREMQAHAAAMEYERAARCKALLEDLERLRRSCRRMFHLPEGRDALLFIRPYRGEGFSLFLIRRRAVSRRRDFAGGLAADALEGFLAAPDAAAAPWLLPALTGIYADKLFVPLPLRWGAAALEKRIRRGYAEFLGGAQVK